MPQLPVPDTDGIYRFPTDLLGAHQAWMAALEGGQIMDLTAPLTGAAYRITARRPTGRPVVVIEPHHDDFVLSAAGHFLTHPRPLTVITVFTRSRSVHPSLEPLHSDVESVSRLRDQEAASALRPLAADRVPLGHKDADPPYRAHPQLLTSTITGELAEVLKEHPEAELIAPAAVTRHPDHLLAHEAARRLGCRWFWEDVAFWPTYALAGCDRHLFHQRTGDTLTPQIADITGAVLDKLTLLHMHGSQMNPAPKMYRPIRHAYTVAADMLPAGRDNGSGTYAERFYRLGGTA
ncbi:PIG-L deacetylase family protein [Streptomyces sp. NRRL F-5126]|uniref:PIG-L deacetylase family protein n=1 Tax=Streptomyces sp. NRRL F-5126 TaxID=1463857 RepID=UPI000A913CB0|nr:PIG-L family deacetylase [Streptomyces sp. NRRL F-5126]